MVNYELKDQKDNTGKVIDKIATITRYIPKTETKSGTELRKRKEQLEFEILERQTELTDINEILGAM